MARIGDGTGKRIPMRIAVHPKDARVSHVNEKGTQYGLDVDQYGVPIHAVNEKGYPICGAQRVKQPKGVICQSVMRMPNGRCKKHGGFSPRGIASSRWKHGRESKYARVLSPAFSQDLQHYLERDKILSNLEEIALTDIMLDDLLQEYHDSDSLDVFTLSELQSALNSLDNALEQLSPKTAIYRARSAREKFAKIVEAGANLTAKRKQIMDLQAHRTKITEAERKAIEGRQKQMGEKEVLSVFSRMAIYVRDRITDDRLYERGPDAMLAALTRDFENMLGNMHNTLLPGSDPNAMSPHDRMALESNALGSVFDADYEEDEEEE